MTLVVASPIPYIILFSFITAVAAMYICRFSSLRNLRRHRNQIIFSLLLLILGLVAYQAYDASLGLAIITNNVSFKDTVFQAGKISKFTITCENLGNRQIDYYLTLTGNNASLTVGDQQNYVQVNATTVQIPFHFSAAAFHAKQTKPVFFTVNGNSANFEITFQSPIIATGGAIGVQGKWNATTNSYVVFSKPGPCV